jgi:hypothetical protein
MAVNVSNQKRIITFYQGLGQSIVTSLSLSSGLKPELASTVVPFILQQVEQLTKTDLADVLKLFIAEMNSVNITDLSFKSKEDNNILPRSRTICGDFINVEVSNPFIVGCATNPVTFLC